MKRTFALLAAALVAVPAFAQEREIEVEERGKLIPSVRIGIDFSPRGETPSVPHWGHGLEIGLTGASGEDTQFRGVGAPPIVFGGQTFLAGSGTTLNHEFEFGFFEIVYRFRHFFGDTKTFGIEALGGLGFATLDLTVSSPTQRANEKLESGGLVGGFGIIWKFLPETSLQSRLTLFGSGEREGVTGAARFDVFVAHALGRHAALRAGLTGWGLASERDEDDDFSSPNSHIRARFGGFALGLDVAF